nr:hypothetical protein GCM10025699_53590 [Microbacterium flavescens]
MATSALPGRRRRGQFDLEGGDEAVLQSGLADLLHDLAEEAEDDETTGLVFGDAPRLEVEEVLVVEASGRAGVTGALDVTRLDLQVRDRIGPGPLAEDEVAVLLVAVGPRRGTADEDVADPDRPGPLALQRALVVDAAA